MAGSRAQQAAIAISMKKAGKKPKALKKAKTGTSVKTDCPAGQCGTIPNCHPCNTTNYAKPTSPLKNILGAIAGGVGIGVAAKIANSEKATEKANAKADIREEKRLLRKSARREKRGFQPISGPSFGVQKKGGTVKTKKK